VTFAPDAVDGPCLASSLSARTQEVRMTLTSTTTTTRRPTSAARRGGYAVAVLFNAALLVALDRWPGWEAVPFLTGETTSVTGLVNASIIVNLVANLVYLLRDPLWLKALGDMVTTTVGIFALVRIWTVFPFDFADSSFDWVLVARIVLGVAVVGSLIGVVAALFTLLRSLFGPRRPA
jgi:hypothetical protein